MMSLWDALRMNMMISYQELVRTFLKSFPGKLYAEMRNSLMELMGSFLNLLLLPPARTASHSQCEVYIVTC